VNLEGKELEDVLRKGGEELGMIRRYSVVSALYPSGRNVMENVVQNFGK
jgi:hypothetical protein